MSTASTGDQPQAEVRLDQILTCVVTGSYRSPWSDCPPRSRYSRAGALGGGARGRSSVSARHLGSAGHTSFRSPGAEGVSG